MRYVINHAKSLSFSGSIIGKDGVRVVAATQRDLKPMVPVQASDASLRCAERAALQAQLKAHCGSRAESARKLGISDAVALEKAARHQAGAARLTSAGEATPFSPWPYWRTRRRP